VLRKADKKCMMAVLGLPSDALVAYDDMIETLGIPSFNARATQAGLRMFASAARQPGTLAYEAIVKYYQSRQCDKLETRVNVVSKNRVKREAQPMMDWMHALLVQSGTIRRILRAADVKSEAKGVAVSLPQGQFSTGLSTSSTLSCKGCKTEKGEIEAKDATLNLSQGKVIWNIPSGKAIPVALAECSLNAGGFAHTHCAFPEQEEQSTLEAALESAGYELVCRVQDVYASKSFPAWVDPDVQKPEETLSDARQLLNDPDLDLHCITVKVAVHMEAEQRGVAAGWSWKSNGHAMEDRYAAVMRVAAMGRDASRTVAMLTGITIALMFHANTMGRKNKSVAKCLLVQCDDTKALKWICKGEYHTLSQEWRVLYGRFRRVVCEIRRHHPEQTIHFAQTSGIRDRWWGVAS